MKPPYLTFYGGLGHSNLFLNLNKILKNSTPGKVACILHIERVQIDAIKLKECKFIFYRHFHCRRHRPCLRSLLLPCEQPLRWTKTGSKVSSANFACRFSCVIIIFSTVFFLRIGVIIIVGLCNTRNMQRSKQNA